MGFYDAGAGLWRQTWLDDRGQPLLLAGGWREGAMSMARLEGAATRDRITWPPRADGTVRQLWEKRGEGGGTWTVACDGFYTGAEPAAR